MAIVTINDENLTNIANAIREKNGTETTYKPSEMAAAIQAISAGGGEVNFVEAALTGYTTTGFTGFNVFDYVDSVDDILCIYIRTYTDYTGSCNTMNYFKGYNFVIENETREPFSSDNPATMLGIVTNPAKYAYSTGVTYSNSGSPAFGIDSNGAIWKLYSAVNNYTNGWSTLSTNTNAAHMHVWMLYK